MEPPILFHISTQSFHLLLICIQYSREILFLNHSLLNDKFPQRVKWIQVLVGDIRYHFYDNDDDNKDDCDLNEIF